MKNYIIVRNPQPRILPRFLRVSWGEEYLGVDVDPFFTPDYSQARVFPSFRWAETYLRDQYGKFRLGMNDCIIRAVSDAHTIPLGDAATSTATKGDDHATTKV